MAGPIQEQGCLKIGSILHCHDPAPSFYAFVEQRPEGMDLIVVLRIEFMVLMTD